MILVFILQLVLSPLRTTHLESYARSHRGVLKSHLVSIDTNMHDKGYYSTFAPVNLVGDATSLVVIISFTAISTSTRQGFSTRRGVDIPGALETCRNVCRGGNLISNLEF